MSKNLFIVSTPIGNKKDITLRAIETLKEADLILAENIRHSRVLLKEYEINTKLKPFNRVNEKKIDFFISLFEEYKNICLICDAGTPLINDSGSKLVRYILQNTNNIDIKVIPGASALTASLSGLGYDGTELLFVGFIPNNNNQIFKILENNPNKNILGFLSPHNYERVIKILKEYNGEIKIGLAKEISKIYETYKFSKVLEFKEENARGEMVILIENKVETSDVKNVEKIVKILRKEGINNILQISKIVSKITGIGKTKIYNHLKNGKY